LIDRGKRAIKRIHDSKEQHGEGQKPRKCMGNFIQDHTLGLGDISNTRIHCRNALVRALSRWRRTKFGEDRPRRWPEHLGGWGEAAVARNPRAGEEKNYPKGQPDPALLYPAIEPAGYSGQS
jgi:hypothetical protein